METVKKPKASKDLIKAVALLKRSYIWINLNRKKNDELSAYFDEDPNYYYPFGKIKFNKLKLDEWCDSLIAPEVTAKVTPKNKAQAIDIMKALDDSIQVIFKYWNKNKSDKVINTGFEKKYPFGNINKDKLVKCVGDWCYKFFDDVNEPEEDEED